MSKEKEGTMTEKVKDEAKEETKERSEKKSAEAKKGFLARIKALFGK